MFNDIINFTLLISSIDLMFRKYYTLNELTVWYLIHSFANFYIVSLCINPISYILKNPLYHLFNPTEYYGSMIAIIILHLYHLLFFNCNKDDIFHHLVFVGIGTITIFVFNNGYYSALSHFFICGFPGGIDYFMLFLYKINYITKETRLRYAVFLNVWIRSPGLCMVSTFSLINFIYSKKTITDIIEFIMQVSMTLINGQMYMRDVLLAAGKKL